MADIERSVEIEQIDYNVDINNVSYSIDILPQNTYTIELNKQGPQGLRGYTGNGIESYELTSTAGLIDTYTITFTDGDTKTVNVTNGADGTSADITSVTATVDSNVGIPSVDVALGGTELSRTIEFDFHNLKGQPGQDGVDGVDGRDGEAATISVGTVTTGLPTDPARVTNVGTSSAAIFDFTIPKGEKGDKGDQGIQGIQGVQGEKGEQGIQGEQGVQGVKGDTGNGVSGVSLLSTIGLVDTYRMSFTNGTYFDYPVKNGQDGTGSVSDVTVNGISVLDGTTAKIDLTDYVTTNTAQTITARKTFTGEKAIYFKQVATTNKLGFTLYNPSDTELGAFEYRPNTISGGALLNVNVPYSSSNYVGFRYWGTAVNVIAPKVATAGNYFIPTHITDGNTTVTADSAGLINISSLLPSGSNNIFWATYGTTTYADITTAINNGKLVLCTYNGDTYYYIGSDNNEVSFVTNTVGTNYIITVDSSDNWTNDSRAIPTFISELTDNTSSYPIDKAKSVVDQNSGSVKMWTGTKAQYDAILNKNSNVLYNVTDDDQASAYEAYTKSETDSMFATVDLDNLSNIGKQEIIDCVMPSTRQIDFTITTTGQTIIMPESGYLQVVAYGSKSSNSFIGLYGSVASMVVPYADNVDMRGFIPVSKGESIQVYFNNATNIQVYLLKSKGVI